MSIYTQTDSGADTLERDAQREQNQGKHMKFEGATDSHLFVPLQYLTEAELPADIQALKATDTMAYIKERVERVAMAFDMVEIWLDADGVKAHNNAQKAILEADKTAEVFFLRNKYGFRVDWNKDTVHAFVDNDPIAWLFKNIETINSTLDIPTVNTFTGKHGVAIKRRCFLIGMDENGSERVLETSVNQFRTLAKAGTKAMDLSGKPFVGEPWQLSRDCPPADKTKTAYDLTPDKTAVIDFEVPEKTTLDLEEIDALGISSEKTWLRRMVLETIGALPHFPSDAVWLDAEKPEYNAD